MKKYWKLCIWLVLLLITFPQAVFANSSWLWLTARPWDLLPVAVAITIILESYIISRCSKIMNIYKVIAAVCAANLISFLAPYLRRTYLSWNYFHRGASNLLDEIGRSFRHAISQPHYTVEILYLVLTLIIEVPLVYLLLQKKGLNKKKLLVSIIAANILTTIITFLIERIFCHGIW